MDLMIIICPNCSTWSTIILMRDRKINIYVHTAQVFHIGGGGLVQGETNIWLRGKGIIK